MNIIPEKRLMALLSIIPDREMPAPTKEAVRLVFISGFNYELASLKAGVSSKRISLAVRKLNDMDAKLLEAYRL
ncbi:hypothetical protein [Vibrio nigripulchritudo]|uniref:hypothetical protein n=1 Tax=Vibrio nigripulchritudo TaxID=28173 RepID=UPI0005FA3EBA|nr:hypothetical protein [Vibrio nigripulchritudo]KJY78949.1 hypothetical protein TW74_09605 [Vibrio nigripulchritudo]